MPVIIGAIIGAASGAMQAEMNDRPWYQGMIWGAVIGGATGYLSGFAPTQWIGSMLYGAGLGAASGGAMAYATGGDVNRSMITGAIVGGAIGFASSEQFGNMVNGQGFRSNDNVLKSFVSKGEYQEALDYFGIQGKYDPSNQIFNNEVGGGAAAVDPETGEIFWGDGAFNYGYDRLAFEADHELIHSQNVLSGKYKDVKIDFEVAGREEWSTYMKNYQRQGLYHNHGVNIISRINQYGSQAGIYGTYVTPTGSYSSNFNVQWWHFIYKIPRRW